MKLRDIPKIVLAESSIPLSAREIWAEAARKAAIPARRGVVRQEGTAS